jgi:hypothetical protein
VAHGPLIKPKVKVIDKKERQKRLEYILKKAHNCYVEAGISEPDAAYPDSKATVGQVAAWMEFGTHTADGKPIVPARSFIRTPVDVGMGSIDKVRARALAGIIEERSSIKDALDEIGGQLVKLMRNAIVRGIAPRLADRTILRKRALGQPDTPLIATRFMFDHIDFHTELNP